VSSNSSFYTACCPLHSVAMALNLGRDCITARVKKDGMKLKSARSWAKDDFNIALAAASCKARDVFGDSLSGYRYVSATMKRNLKVVKEALKVSSKQLRYVPRSLKRDPLLRFRLLSLRDKSYRAECMNLVMTDCFHLRRYPAKIRGDKEIVLAHVKNNGFDLEWATHALKADLEVVRASLKGGDEFEGGYRSAHSSLKADPTVIREAIQLCPQTMRFVAKDIKEDIELAQLSMENHDSAIKFLESRFKDDYSCNLFAVQKRYAAIMHVSEVFKNNLSISIAACRTYIDFMGERTNTWLSQCEWFWSQTFCYKDLNVKFKVFENAVQSCIAVEGEPTVVFCVNTVDQGTEQTEQTEQQTFKLIASTLGGSIFTGVFQEDAKVSHLAKKLSEFWKCKSVYIAFGAHSVTPLQSEETILKLFKENS
jgi:hypothetical protein